MGLLSRAFLHTLELHGFNHCEIRYQGGIWVCRLQLLLATCYCLLLFCLYSYQLANVITQGLQWIKLNLYKV